MVSRCFFFLFLIAFRWFFEEIKLNGPDREAQRCLRYGF